MESLQRVRWSWHSITNRLRKFLLRFLGFDPYKQVSLAFSAKEIGEYSLLATAGPEYRLTHQRLFGNSETQFVIQERKIYSLKHSIVYSSSALVALNGSIVEESSAWAPEVCLFENGEPPSSPKRKLTGSLTPIGSNEYYHFLLEDLPSILIARELNPEIGILAPQRSRSYLDDALEICSAPRVERYSLPVQVENLVILSKGGVLGRPSPLEVKVLREFRNQSVNTPGAEEWLYISRSKSSRSPSFERRLEKRAQELGFRVIHLQDYSLREQMIFFSSASKVAGVHGAGLANTVFMSPGTEVLEILDPSWPNQCFEFLAIAAQLSFQRLILSGDEERDALNCLAALSAFAH